MYMTKYLHHALWCLKNQIVEHSYMFIVMIIAQLGVSLDTWSQLTAAGLDTTGFGSRQL